MDRLEQGQIKRTAYDLEWLELLRKVNPTTRTIKRPKSQLREGGSQSPFCRTANPLDKAILLVQIQPDPLAGFFTVRFPNAAIWIGGVMSKHDRDSETLRRRAP